MKKILEAIRQGDVILVLNSRIPKGAKKLSHLVLAEGEITGHKHQVKEGNADLYEANGKLFLRVNSNEAIIGHEEHKQQVISKGDIEIRFPSEYDYVEEQMRKVQD